MDDISGHWDVRAGDLCRVVIVCGYYYEVEVDGVRKSVMDWGVVTDYFGGDFGGVCGVDVGVTGNESRCIKVSVKKWQSK